MQALLTTRQIKKAYDSIRNTGSTSPYFEDLLDRAKDYLYETRSSCEYALRKNREEDLIESSQYAGTGVGFFDRIFSEAELNK